MEEKVSGKKDGVLQDDFLQKLLLVLLIAGASIADMLRRNDNPFTGVSVYIFIAALVMATERYFKLQRDRD